MAAGILTYPATKLCASEPQVQHTAGKVDHILRSASERRPVTLCPVYTATASLKKSPKYESVGQR
jgi:hypothetical protein